MRFFKKMKVEMILGLTFFSFILLGMAENKNSFQSDPFQDEALKHQISEDINYAITLNQAYFLSPSFKKSGYTAADIFKNVNDLKNPAAWEALCDKLLTLQQENLTFFESELINDERINHLPKKCQNLLKTS
jgi:hypothetical protein